VAYRVQTGAQARRSLSGAWPQYVALAVIRAASACVHLRIGPLRCGPAVAKAPPQQSPARSAALDGVRALAALSVLCFHAWLYRVGEAPGQRTDVIDKVLFEASVGLICFFVLSGFLLYRPFARAALTGGRSVDVGHYALRRAVRILPAYYASLLGCLLLYWAVGYSTIVPSAEHLPLFAVLAQNYSMDTVMKINPVTWTLSVEAAFYVLLPLLGLIAFVLGPKRAGHQAAILIGLVALTIAWNALLHNEGWGALASKALPTYIGYFAIGMLTAMWVELPRRRYGRPASLGPTPTAGLVALGLSCVAGNAYWHETAGSFTSTWILFGNLPAALGLALVITAAAAGTGPAMSWLAARPLAGLGLISYGIYLWHLPLILLVRQVGLLPATFAPRFVLVLLLAIGAGTLSWILVERPIIRLMAARRDHMRALPDRRASAAALAET
jgi:peptidoglycan/LPS O-acetylase OafA/YrhL